MNIDDLFNGGGAPVLKFPTVGTTHFGEITHLEARQQRDFDRNEPLTWDDGSPKMELVITIETADGPGRLFVKGAMLSAMREEIRRLGLKRPEIGGQLAVRYDHDGENKNPKLNPPKIYVVGYEPPKDQTDSAVANLIAGGLTDNTPTGGSGEVNNEALAALLANQ